MSSNNKPFAYSRRSFLRTTTLATGGVIIYGCANQGSQSLVEILHFPETVSRRSGALSANVSGRYAKNVEQIRYRVNAGDWITFSPDSPRVPSPFFTLEMRAEALKEGSNELTIEATPNRGEPEITTLSFDYQPAPVVLPITTDWSNIDSRQLDVQDGLWETFATDDDGWRVRPKPGYEDYDRLLNVTGAFPGGRRVETTLTLRNQDDKNLYGFGLLTMWGGHPDEADVSPRRGWSFGISWYYSFYKGVGSEFSYKQGKEKPAWLSAYRNYDHKADTKYRLISECFSETDAAGNHLRYRQQMKWFVDGEAEPEDWVTLVDPSGEMVPEGEYSVAIVAHRSQAEFGPVTVTPVEPVQVES